MEFDEFANLQLDKPILHGLRVRYFQQSISFIFPNLQI